MNSRRIGLLAVFGVAVALTCGAFIYVQDQRWRTAYDAGWAASTEARYDLAEKQFNESLAAAS